MNSILKSIALLGVIAGLGLAGTQPAFAKAHDQGVADGDRTPGESQAGGAGVGGQGGISENVNDGQRGDAASGAGSENNGDKGLGRDNGQGNN